MILKIAASLFTGIGGHYLNRRWDKAILFFCLFVCAWIAAYVALILSLQYLSGAVSGLGDRFETITRIASGASTACIFILWLISLTITIADARKSVEPNMVKWTGAGAAGAVLTSVLSFLLLVYSVTTFATVYFGEHIYDALDEPDTGASGYMSGHFYESVYFGGSPNRPFNLPSPPAGNGILKGKVTYHGQPAVDVTLSVILNSKYKAEDIITDSEGIFLLNLPPGSWTVNSISAEKWPNKPQTGRFSMYYGGEQKLSGSTYNPHGYINDGGHRVEVTTRPAQPQFNLVISDDIELLWPDPSSKGIEATMDETIQWDSHPDASQYYVEIKKITRKGDTVYYERVASRTLHDTTAIPLSSFEHRKTKGNESTEYAAEIYAFSGDGSLVSEFTDTFQGGTFFLSDGNILVKEELDDLFGLSAMPDDEFEETMNALARNQQRADAVSTLIADDMLDEAAALLDLLESEYAKGRKEVLAGYIYAIKGECDRSAEMFAKAESINPNVCIPDNYRAPCE